MSPKKIGNQIEKEGKNKADDIASPSRFSVLENEDGEEEDALAEIEDEEAEEGEVVSRNQNK